MSEAIVSSIPLARFGLWEKIGNKGVLSAFEMEVTARCNNNCVHCYINLPAGDRGAKEKEISFHEIKEIVDEAVSLGALWCLITGGEPLLREDFSQIYLYLKKKGILISVFTNATLITEDHVRLFKRYPPRNIEVSVYGVTEETYERVTRTPGSFAAFIRGLDLLMENGIKVRLKAMIMRSNVHESPEIIHFCREKTKDYFRFDPFIHLRYDGDPVRNEQIKAERLSPREIVSLERSDPDRFEVLKKVCENLITQKIINSTDNLLFRCGAGEYSFTLSYDGLFRLCSSLWHPDAVYDLRKRSLTEAWQKFVPQVRNLCSNRRQFLETCKGCHLINLCMWCPALAHLETGDLDMPVDYFCHVAHAREEALIHA
ncbi:MAG: radical SAM protein [Pseudomonadota bacterium]